MIWDFIFWDFCLCKSFRITVRFKWLWDYLAFSGRVFPAWGGAEPHSAPHVLGDGAKRLAWIIHEESDPQARGGA